MNSVEFTLAITVYMYTVLWNFTKKNNLSKEKVTPPPYKVDNVP